MSFAFIPCALSSSVITASPEVNKIVLVKPGFRVLDHPIYNIAPASTSRPSGKTILSTFPWLQKTPFYDPNSPKAPAGDIRRVLLWFHTDLRLDDNQALVSAVRSSQLPGGALVPFCSLRAVRRERWGAVKDVAMELKKKGSGLVVGDKTQDVAQAMLEVCMKKDLRAVYVNAAVEENEVKLQEKVAKVLQENGIELTTFWSNSLVSPQEVSKEQKAFSKFTSHIINIHEVSKPVDAPTKIPLLDADLARNEHLLESARSHHLTKSKAMELVNKIGSTTERLAVSKMETLAPWFALKPYLDAGIVSPKMVTEKIFKVLNKLEGYTFMELAWRSYTCLTLNVRVKNAVAA